MHRKQILATGQGGLWLPDRDYYLGTDDSQQDDSRAVCRACDQDVHAAGRLARAGRNRGRRRPAHRDGNCHRWLSRTEMRDPAKRYHIMKVDELQALSPGVQLGGCLEGERVGTEKTIDVMSPGYVKAVNGVLETESLDALKHYMRWHTLRVAAPPAIRSVRGGELQLLPGDAEWTECSRLRVGSAALALPMPRWARRWGRTGSSRTSPRRPRRTWTNW